MSVVAIYARQSVDKKDSISIETQIKMCRQELIDNPEAKIEIYIDKGYSGKNTNRPELIRMTNDINNGLISKIIVYKLDRISRSVLDFAEMVENLRKNNVDFQSTKEKFDTSTPMGNAMLNIAMVFAQLERETIQQRITDNYYERGKKGFFLYAKTPYGFNKEPIVVGGIKTSVLIENLETSQIVKKLYHDYAYTDISLNKLVHWLNDNNIKSPSGKGWGVSSLCFLLRNPTYVKADSDIYQFYKNKGCIMNNPIEDYTGKNGCLLYGKRDLKTTRKFDIVEGHEFSLALHDGFIDSDTFLHCQARFASNEAFGNAGKGHRTWLSGLVKCAKCGYSLGLNSGRGNMYKYFKCKGKDAKHICEGFSHTIYREDIEKFTEESIFNMMEEKKELQLVSLNNNKDKENELKIKIASIEEQVENLMSALANGSEVITKYINKKIDDLDRTKSALICELEKIQRENRTTKEIPVVKNLRQKWKDIEMEEKKKIAHALISKILVDDDQITIIWKHVKTYNAS